MKTLILIRHGKSDWSAGVSDKERSLSYQGLDDAPLMAKFLQSEGYIPELLYISNAKRATETADILAQKLLIPHEHLIISPELYLCDVSTVEEVIHFTPPDKDKIAVVGHNPTLSEVAGMYCKKRYIEMPTLGVFICTFDTNNWSEISRENAIKQTFVYPRLFK